MKTFIVSMTLILMGLSSTAQADLKLASPEALLAKANRGRAACRDVILDISLNVQEMRDPATFDRYFSILGNLSAIAEKHKLEEIYPDAVKSLGLRMVGNGVRWLSITNDSSEKILSYHDWMNTDTAYVFQSNIELATREVTDNIVLKKLAENTEALMAFADLKFAQNIDLRNGYRRILSDLAAKKLKETGVTSEDYIFWLSKLSTPQAYAVAIDSVHVKTLALSASDKTMSHEYAKSLKLLAQKALSEAANQPGWLFSQIADVSQELILKNIDLKEPFSAGEFESLMALLTSRHLQGLAQQWTDADRIPDSAYVEHYLELTRKLILQLRKFNLEKEANEVKKFEERLAAPIVGKSKQIEGSYLLTDPKGKKWIFTAVLARQALIYVELADLNGVVNKAYFNITYAVEDDSFVGSEREVDLDPGRNLTLRFRLLGNGEIEVRDLMAPPEIQNLKGTKFESYPDYFPLGTNVGEDPSGTYKGIVYFGKDFKTEISLIVTGFNGYSLGRATSANGAITLDLNMGTRGTDKVLYLTTGRIRNSHWIQLRGMLRDGEFHGHSIIGGRGISKKEFILKKVLN